MLTIAKIKVGIDTVYEKVYYDGTQQELENQLNGINIIPFLQQKQLQNSYKTIYLHPRAITAIEVDDYIKKEPKQSAKVIDFESYKNKEEKENPLDTLSKEELEFVTQKCQGIMNGARNEFEEEKSIQICETLLQFFVAHHTFIQEDKDEELEEIFTEQYNKFKEGLLENKHMTEEQIKELYLDVAMSMPQFTHLDELKDKKEEMEMFVQIFLISMHLIAWIGTMTKEESKEAIKPENQLMNTINFIAFTNGDTKEETK